MLRNIVPAIISPGQTLSSVAASPNFSLAGVCVGHTFSGQSLTFAAQDSKGNIYPVSDGSGGTLTRTCRADDYVWIPRDAGMGVDRVLFAANTSQVTNACTLLAVFISNS